MIGFPNDFLKGTCEITDNLIIAKEAIYHQPEDLRVVMISEEDDLSQNHPCVLKASILMPPVEAQIAEVDGLADKFMAIYASHLGEDPFNKEYIMALITFIHRGGTVMFYCKDLNLYFIKQFLRLMYDLYGIGIPISGTNQIPVYNYRHKPQWLLGMFRYHTIDKVEFCLNYPLDAQIPEEVVDDLIHDFGIYADTYEQAVVQMRSFHEMIQKNPMIQNALISIDTFC